MDNNRENNKIAEQEFIIASLQEQLKNQSGDNDKALIDKLKEEMEEQKKELEKLKSKENTRSAGNKNTLLLIVLSLCLCMVILAIALLANMDSKKDNDIDVPLDGIVTDGSDNGEKKGGSFINSLFGGEEKDEADKISDTKIEEIINSGTSYTDYGIYVKNLTTGDEYGYNADTVFLSSALSQIVIIDTVADACEENNIDMYENGMQFNYMPNGKESPGSKDEDGKVLSVIKYIEDVARYGDNNKSNSLIDVVGYLIADDASRGFEVMNNRLRARGFGNTNVSRKIFINTDNIDESSPPNRTTPKDITNIFNELLNNQYLGTKNEIKNMFSSINSNYEAIGIKKYIPSDYEVYNVNAFNSRSTNDVALISKDGMEIIVAILSCTDENKVSLEGNDVRETISSQLVNYLIDAQFN